MILAVLFANSEGNILVERSVYIVYMALEDVNIYVVGKDECDELAYILKGYLENTDKDRIKRLVHLKPPTEF